MERRDCLELCPRIVECREQLMTEMQTPSAVDERRAAAELDQLVDATAQVATAACFGPQVVQQTVEKGGYFQSKKQVTRNVYVCGQDGYTQRAVYYFQNDKMS